MYSEAIVHERAWRRLTSGDGSSYSLRCCMEDSLEHRFSQVKAPFRGTPSLKDAVVSGHLLHVRQSRSSIPVTCLAEPGAPLSKRARDLRAMANEALDTACVQLVVTHGSPFFRLSFR